MNRLLFLMGLGLLAASVFAVEREGERTWEQELRKRRGLRYRVGSLVKELGWWL